MENQILKEFQELKNLTLLGAKQALTMDDAALLTGLSKSHLYKLCCKKSIPYYKNGGKLTYFEKGELTEWLLQHRVKTNDELTAEAVTYVVTKTSNTSKKCGNSAEIAGKDESFGENKYPKIAEGVKESLQPTCRVDRKSEFSIKQ